MTTKQQVTLTDRFLKSSKCKPQAKAYEHMEGDGFGFRIQPGGAKSFILFKRFPGSTNPVRRTIGHYPAMSLAQAREKAGQWRELIAKGIDPAIEEKRLVSAAIAAEKAKQAATFGAAFAVYERRKLAKLRTGKTIAAELRRECAAWFDLPLADIDRRMVKNLILAIADRPDSRRPTQGQGCAAQAHQTFAFIRAFFNWICDNVDDYGVENSPCLKLKPIALIGRRVTGRRVLSDVEIGALWRACEALGHPNGNFVKLLLLSAVRRSEAACMQWREVDLKDGVWIIDAERMKGGEAHLVSLVPDLRELIDSLPPRGKGGDYVFSNSGGLLPIQGFNTIKQRLDKLMKADLAAQGVGFEPFRLHDVRRSVRTQLSKLRISGEVCEAILAHAKPGLNKVYNLHEYQDEKAEALTLWHAKLRAILTPEPGPDNVVPWPTRQACA